jgi:hypothetical protein
MSQPPQQHSSPPAAIKHGATTCLLIAALVFLQSLWITHHLATECHLPVFGWQENSSARLIASRLEDAPQVGQSEGQIERGWPKLEAAPKPQHDPHCALDHELTQDNRPEATHLPTPSAHRIPTQGPSVVATHTHGVRTGAPQTGPPLAEAIDVAAACPRAPPLI